MMLLISSNVNCEVNIPFRFGTGKRTENKVPNFPGPAEKNINLKTGVSYLLY